MINDSTFNMIASFSLYASYFAFQSRNSQNGIMDFYPIEPSNDYKVNSSLVDHFDYDANELIISDIKFSGWCCNAISNLNSRGKRKRSEGSSDKFSEPVLVPKNFFVNVLSDGKIIVYSPSDKSIVNIIQTKRDIVGFDTNGSSLWTLDINKTVNQFDSVSSIPLKTISLDDYCEGEILYFQVLCFTEFIYLAIITDNDILIIDPSNAEPKKIVTLSFPNCVSCSVLDDEHVVLASVETISIVNFRDMKEVNSWDCVIDKIKVISGNILSLDVDGKLSIFVPEKKSAVCSISAQASKILDFNGIGSDIIIAWLNFNEPKFEIVTSQQISNSEHISFNTNTTNVYNDIEDMEVNIKDDGVSDTGKRLKKITKTEQDELSQQLLNLLEITGNSEDLINILVSENWTEDRIKSFVKINLNEKLCETLFNTLSNELINNAWTNNTNIHTWLKWILSLRSSQIGELSSHNNKKVKQLKSSLRISGGAFRTLLSLQGKLDMLKSQVNLRNEFSHITLDESNVSEVTEETNEKENDIVYINGEGEEYDDIHISET